MIDPTWESGNGPGQAAGLAVPSVPQTTGRYVVVFADVERDPAPLLSSVAGLASVATSRDFDNQAVDFTQTGASDGVVFSELGIAVIAADAEQRSALQSNDEAQRVILSISPELIHHILPDDAHGYVQGYRDGVGDLAGRLGATGQGSAAGLVQQQVGASFQDTGQFTWGLQATGVSSSPRSGAGVKVAVLDTGFDAQHPDFVGRNITGQSFVPGESWQDGHGHGTHCIGTACGPKAPATLPRYGIAHQAQIFAGKVLSNQGSGSDGGIIAGINWAVTNGCDVISMSLGADVPNVHPPYTAAGSRALDRGTLIVAAAGNNADRRVGRYGFVGPPANSPYIMAVGALDQQLAVTFFSARSLPQRGGQVDLAGPGWQVYSSWPMPTRYRTISGTSMATPHAAGVAALWAEATGLRGRGLWAVLSMEGQRLIEPSVDVGPGLVTAPQQ